MMQQALALNPFQPENDVRTDAKIHAQNYVNIPVAMRTCQYAGEFQAVLNQVYQHGFSPNLDKFG